MGILRTDVVSHSQLPSANGSIELDGTTDFIQIGASKVFRFADANALRRSFTIEWFIYLNTTSGYHNAFDINYTGGLVIEGTGGVYSVYGGGQTLINEGQLEAATANRWYHYALVMEGGPAGSTYDIILYRDGKVSGQGTLASNVALGSNSNNLAIGARQSNGANSLNGFISNFRISEEAVYKGEFTPPKFKLKALPSTLVLCCQSSTSATEAAVSPTSVSANGNATASAFGPGLKDDITDVGTVFDGVTNFDSQAFMVPPSGKITQRNRGRGIFAGGVASPNEDIQVIDISSGGIAQDFGDLNTAASLSGSASSSTRMLVTGMSDPAPTNIIEFITIASIASSTDYGDLTVARRRTQSLSNSTRAVHVAGSGASPTPYFNTIDFNTIATAGNSQDFGDTDATTLSHGGSVASSTRGIYSVGYEAPAYSNAIEFITIATTGNGQDFGDLSAAKGYHFRGSICDTTRGLFAGGYNPAQNTIDFVTMASAGNASDFGDLTQARRSGAGTANSIHSIFAGGYLPGVVNTIDRVLIQTTGNAADFGDFFLKTHENSGSSDSHGGLE